MAKSAKSAASLFDDLPAAAAPKPQKGPARSRGEESYTAADIEVLEGLEPVRRRPGMYIGGTDEKALHHLFAEVIDNAMDEAVAGHASWIEVDYDKDGWLTVTDNGRGIPVDPHPKFPDKSALEVILSTLHSGGKFNGKAYSTSGGLHGVGVSVVNALSSDTIVEVARNKELFRQRFARGVTLGPLEKLGPVNNRRGTSVTFTPDTVAPAATVRGAPSITSSALSPRLPLIETLCAAASAGSRQSRAAGAMRSMFSRAGW